MTEQSNTREAAAWVKQRLGELDAIIATIEKSAAQLKESSHKEVQFTLARLQQSRSRIQSYSDNLRNEVDAARLHAGEALKSVEDEWLDVEVAFQHFLSTASGEAQAVRDALAARAHAQRQSWEQSLKDLRGQAREMVEKAREEFDEVYRRLSDEAEKFQGRIGDARDAGDESWKALKAGLAEVRDVQSRTFTKIKEAFVGLF